MDWARLETSRLKRLLTDVSTVDAEPQGTYQLNAYDISAALEARRAAVNAAKSAGLREREATLTCNLGFALTTIGARQEARASLDRGFELADAIGSSGTVRHAQMLLEISPDSFRALSEPSVRARSGERHPDETDTTEAPGEDPLPGSGRLSG